MGVNDRQQDAKADKRAKAKTRRQARSAGAGEYDEHALDWVLLATFIMAMAREGGAVRFGYTRDGGALALGMYMDDDYATEYIRPAEDLQEALGEIAQIWLHDGGQRWLEDLIKARSGA